MLVVTYVHNLTRLSKDTLGPIKDLIIKRAQNTCDHENKWLQCLFQHERHICKTFLAITNSCNCAGWDDPHLTYLTHNYI